MTAEEANTVVGLDDETRENKKKAKRKLQKVLNGMLKERNKAVSLILKML